jgi:L-alanine-DL-glutamate epimerase-like enolase superfamily enzyme
MISRRNFLAAMAAGVPAPQALHAGRAGVTRPGDVKRLRITKVHTVEVRGVTTGNGLVLPWDSTKKPRDTRDYVVTQLLTDRGLIGTTIDGDYSLRKGIGKIVQEWAEPYFVGKDPFDIELHNAEFFRKHKSPVRLNFLEVALWDLIGKVCGQPLFRLWGAHSDRVRPYAATVHFDKTPAERAEDALKFYELGFRAIKLRLHHLEPSDDLALAAAVTEAAGDKMAVMFDANQAGKRPDSPPPVWDYERTAFMARELEQMGVYWLEEPMNRNNLDDLARVRKQLTRMHLAGAEGDKGLERFRPSATSSPILFQASRYPRPEKSPRWPMPSASFSARTTAKAASGCWQTSICSAPPPTAATSNTCTIRASGTPMASR